MVYLHTDNKDNVEGQLKNGITASTLSFLLNTSEGDNFPITINGQATGVGDSITLEETGIESSGIAVGDHIWNVTDSDPFANEYSVAVVVEVNTNEVITTPLEGGDANIWDAGDEWSVNPFVITLEERTAAALPYTVDTMEKILIPKRSGDTLTIPVASGYRGYSGTTPTTFSTDDYVSLYVEEEMPKNLWSSVANLFGKLLNFIRKDGTVEFTGDQPMGNNKITGLKDATAGKDAVNKDQLDAAANLNEFLDNVFRVKNSGTPTKKAAFNAGSISDATTRTITLQDKSGTMALLSDLPSSANVFFQNAISHNPFTGDDVVAHGLGGTPDAYIAFIQQDQGNSFFFAVQLQSITANSSNITTNWGTANTVIKYGLFAIRF